MTERDRLVTEHRHLCRRASRRFLRPGIDRADLEQIGAIGLIKACDRFDPTQSASFETFAWWFIIGELMHYVRDNERLMRAPRKIWELERHVQRAQERLGAELGRDPTIEEVALALSIEADDVRQARLSRLRAVPDSLENETLPDPGSECRELLERESHLAMDELIKSLNATERTIILALYHAGYSQLEIAKRLGYSRRHISRLHRGALKKIEHTVLTGT